MFAIIKRTIGPLVFSLAASCSTAFAASGPLGVWYDHTGRGAVEITDCNGKLCGRLVWLKEASHKDGCGLQIFGDVKPVANGKWDNGWIIDPEKDLKTKYDVEITLQGDNKLKVLGYAGTKFLSQTMIWTKAPADLKRCTETAARAPESAPAPARRPNDEPPTVYPPPAAQAPPAPAPGAGPEEPKSNRAETPKSAAKSKDCRVEFGGVVLTFPCLE
jgi:uncharacterized protein (DUF2147 family)